MHSAVCAAGHALQHIQRCPLQVSFLVVVQPRHSRARQQKQLFTQAASDYVATASDASVLQRPLKEELHQHEVRKVFGFASNLKDK